MFCFRFLVLLWSQGIDKYNRLIAQSNPAGNTYRSNVVSCYLCLNTKRNVQDLSKCLNTNLLSIMNYKVPKILSSKKNTSLGWITTEIKRIINVKENETIRPDVIP